MQYVYRRTELRNNNDGDFGVVWTVGYYDDELLWHPHSDYTTPSDAAKVMCELNGWIKRPKSLKGKARLAAGLLNEFSHDHTAMAEFGSMVSADTGLHAAHLVEQEEARRSTAAEFDDDDNN